jgi:hypothetical protein
MVISTNDYLTNVYLNFDYPIYTYVYSIITLSACGSDNNPSTRASERPSGSPERTTGDARSAVDVQQPGGLARHQVMLEDQKGTANWIPYANRSVNLAFRWKICKWIARRIGDNGRIGPVSRHLDMIGCHEQFCASSYLCVDQMYVLYVLYRRTTMYNTFRVCILAQS